MKIHGGCEPQSAGGFQSCCWDFTRGLFFDAAITIHEGCEPEKCEGFSELLQGFYKGFVL